jgi:hypothetical protein
MIRIATDLNFSGFGPDRGKLHAIYVKGEWLERCNRGKSRGILDLGALEGALCRLPRGNTVDLLSVIPLLL